MIEQLVVFRSGEALTKRVSTGRRAGARRRARCAAGDGTALAALVRSRPRRLRIRDFGSCSRRPRDGAGLFVESIRSDRNRGQNGWVYKVGRRGATAGAADPSGPFGRGRLRAGQRVTWFYCRSRRRLPAHARAAATRAGEVVVTVRGYDDEGRGVAIEGATVRAGRGRGHGRGRRAAGARRARTRLVAEQGRPGPVVRRAGRGAVRRIAALARRRCPARPAAASARARSRRATASGCA